MRILTTIGALALSGSLIPAAPLQAAEAGTETVEPPPLVDLINPDMARTRDRFAGSIYGRLWQDPALRGVRARLDTAIAQVAAELGGDPRMAITGVDRARLQFGAPRGLHGQPSVTVQIEGTEAAAFLAGLLAEQAQPGEIGTRPQALGFVHDADRLLLAANGARLAPLVPSEPVAPDADLVVRWFRSAIIDQMRTQAAPRERDLVALVEHFLPAGHYRARLTEHGVRQTLHLETAPAGLAPVDRELLARLPADALAVVAVGLDGSDWWQAHRDAILPLVARELPGAHGDVAAAEQQLSALIQGFGIRDGLDGLTAAVDGTAVLVIGRGGGLVPSISIGLPRTATLDTLVTMGAGMGGVALPADGAVNFLVLRGRGPGGNDLAPGVALARDRGHWWLSTDALLLEALVSGETSGWAESMTGRAVLAAADEASVLLGGADAPEVLRSLVPLAAIAASFADRGRHIQGLGAIAMRFAREAGPETLIAGPRADGAWEAVHEGATGGVVALGLSQAALLAAMAVPDLVEARTAANEAAAASHLKHGIFPSMITYQSLRANNLDRDGEGEYGYLPQLAGTAASFGSGESDGAIGEFDLLPATFGEADDTPIDGYHFTVYLPDGEGGGMDFETARAKVAAGEATWTDGAERYFVAYAWPADPGQGRKVFAMTQRGEVRQRPAEGMELPPAWNALVDGAEGVSIEDFEDRATW